MSTRPSTQPLNLTSGYTLLEMLLVISLIAMLTSTGILIYRHHQINNRTEKAALEMQNVLNAAMNFRNDQNKWPLPNNDPYTCSQPNTLAIQNNFVKNYLPNQDATTLFGNTYCWGSLHNAQTIFWLAVAVPHNDIFLAKRIAALLPNAITTREINSAQQAPCTPSQGTTASSCYVRVELVYPAVSTSSLQLAAIGNCNYGSKSSNNPCQFNRVNADGTVDYTVSFHCPASLQGSLIAYPNFYDIGRTSKRFSSYTLATVSVKALHTPCPQDQEGRVTCTLHINARRGNTRSIVNRGKGYVGASYTAFCYANTTHPTLTSHNAQLN